MPARKALKEILIDFIVFYSFEYTINTLQFLLWLFSQQMTISLHITFVLQLLL